MKTKSLIMILLMGIYSCSQINSSKKKNDWKLFVEENIGYSIEYPSKWIAKGGKGGFMCGKKGGFINAEWTMWLSKPSDTERIDLIFNKDGLYNDYDILEKPIIINGINGFHSVITNKEKPDEFIEFIVIKTESLWYIIENDGVRDNRFEQFYKSFKIIN